VVEIAIRLPANPAGVKTKATLTWGQAPDIYVQSGGTYLIEYARARRRALEAGGLGRRRHHHGRHLRPRAGTSGFGVRRSTRSAWRARASARRRRSTASTPRPRTSNFAVQAYGGAAKFTWTKQGTTLATDLA
jgi:hypothetical protein